MNEKEKFAKRFNEALDKENIPSKGKGRQLYVAQMFNVSQESARRWLEGNNLPQTERMFEIARKLDVNQAWLMTGQGHMNPNAHVISPPTLGSPSWKNVPVLSWEEAGRWQKYIDDKQRQTVWATANLSSSSYALIVKDEDMIPRYEKGSKLIIDPLYPETNKHKVIYLLEGSSQVTCKQLLIDGRLKILKSHDPSYPVIQITDKDLYCGSVRQVRMDFL